MKANIIIPALAVFSALVFSGCGKKEGTEKTGGENAATTSTATTGGGGATSKGTAGGMQLTTQLPPELIEGTPKPIKEPNLVPAPKKAREFLVPEGTVLLSKGKKVTSSDDDPMIGTLDLVTDGEKEAGEGYFVELWEGKQWIQIDLGESDEIYAVWVWHFHSQKRAYKDVIIQISDDPEFKTGVTTIYNNDYDNSAKLGKGGDRPYVESRFGLLVDAKGTKGRYVRLYSNGNSSNEMNHYIEVEVWGKPAGGAAAPKEEPKKEEKPKEGGQS